MTRLAILREAMSRDWQKEWDQSEKQVRVREGYFPEATNFEEEWIHNGFDLRFQVELQQAIIFDYGESWFLRHR